MQLGAVLLDRYEIVAELGRGELGTVVEAWDRELGAAVALKRLREPSRDGFASLLGELRIAVALTHPNLARHHELHVAGDECFIAMELVRGVPFTRAIARRAEAGDAAGVVDLARQLAEGLTHVHQAGFVHRDVKPANVLVDESGRVVVLDFGLALGLRSSGSDHGGTPRYTAPEALWGTATALSDWYSVGAMLAEALERPLRGPSRPPSADDFSAALPRGTPPAFAAWTSSLLALDPARRSTGHELFRELGLPATPLDRVPFVGRAAELASLTRALDEARGGAAQRVALVGEPGIGKSTLLERFLGAAVDVTVLRATCSHAEVFPFAAIDSLAQALARALGTLPRSTEIAELREDASAAFPVLAPTHRGVRKREIGVPAEARGRAHRALLALLVALARTRPVVLAVDDVHWIDPDGAALLDGWLGELGGEQVVAVLTSRPAPPTHVARLLEKARTRIELGPLDDAESSELARSLGGQTSTEAAGNPLAVVQHARPPIPSSPLHGALAAVVAAAVAPLPRGVACRAANVGDDAVGVLRDLESARIVRLDTTGRRLVPYHDLVRRSSLDRMSEGALRELHGRIVDALDEAAISETDLLVPHLRAAGRSAEAARRALVGADRARESLAFEKEALYARWACEGADEDTRVVLRIREATAWRDAGKHEQAARTFEEAQAIAPADARRAIRLDAAEAWVRAGRVELGEGTFLEMLAEARVRPASSPGAQLARGLARRARYLVAPPKLPVNLPERSRDDAKLDLLFRTGNSLSMARNSLAFELLGTFLVETWRDPSRVRLAEALGTEAVFAAALGGAWLERRSATWLTQLDSLAATDEPYVVLGRSIFRGLAAWYRARWAESAAHSKDAMTRLRRDFPTRAWDLRVCAQFATSATFFLGDATALRELASEEIAAAGDRADPMARVYLTLGDAGLVHLLDDAPERAVEALRATEEIAPVNVDTATYARTVLEGNLLLYQGRFGEAARTFGERERMLEAGGVLGSIPRSWLAFGRARATWAHDPHGQDRSTRKTLREIRKALRAKPTPAHDAWQAHVAMLDEALDGAPPAERRADVAARYRVADMQLFAWAVEGSASDAPAGLARPDRVAAWLDPSRAR